MFTAVWSSSADVWAMSPTRAGAADHMSATAPAVCGEAMEVPENAAYPPPSTADRTLTPGAARFGLMPLDAAPRLENGAMAPLMSYAPEE